MMNAYSYSAELDRVRRELKEIAAQSYKLSIGLQNAAPAQPGGISSAIRYLLDISIYIDKISQNINDSGTIDPLINANLPGNL